MTSLQRQHALEFFAFIDNHDYDALADLMSENYNHSIFPHTLRGFGMASRNKQQTLDLLKALEGMVEKFNFQSPQDIIQEQDTVILQIACDGKTVSGNEYKLEYMFTFRFEGEKITNVKEFTDSKYLFGAVERESAAGVETAQKFQHFLDRITSI